jgi:hypothetical protein
MKARSVLFWIHRWLGIGMCLIFALWFASGIVMMYVEYPELTEQERLTALPPLNTSQVQLTPIEAASSIISERSFLSVNLLMVLGRPAYQYTSVRGSQYTVFADTGDLFSGTNQQTAVLAARNSNFVSGSEMPTHEGEFVLDQWTVSAALDAHRPLHKVNINDESGTTVYISSITGQIVRDTNRNERFWNWLGSTIHWIYPVQLRKDASLWNDVVVYLSLIGIVSVITGGIIGIMRIRLRNPYRGTSVSPYVGWMKWHHIGGILSVVFVSTFIFSGLMSMGPWGIFNPQSSSVPQIDRYTGGRTIRLSDLPMPDYSQIEQPVKEIRWHKINNTPYFIGYESVFETFIGFSGNAIGNQAEQLQQLIAGSVPKLLPDNRLISLDLLSGQDNYYYSRRNHHRPLPVYRAKFDDSESTWYHIDASTGQPVNRVTDTSRRERWLFNGLHSLDLQILLQARPLWDVVVILLSLVGFGFSITGVVIGWRRLTS